MVIHGMHVSHFSLCRDTACAASRVVVTYSPVQEEGCAACFIVGAKSGKLFIAASQHQKWQAMCKWPAKKSQGQYVSEWWWWWGLCIG